MDLDGCSNAQVGFGSCCFFDVDMQSSCRTASGRNARASAAFLACSPIWAKAQDLLIAPRDTSPSKGTVRRSQSSLLISPRFHVPPKTLEVFANEFDPFVLIHQLCTSDIQKVSVYYARATHVLPLVGKVITSQLLAASVVQHRMVV